MATYKVPQDVEADDKLIGPFSFRQFIYLVIVALSIAAAWGLFQLFPLLIVIPLPIILFFGALALPLRKDQPMEIYMAAMVSYYLKPHRRTWTADGIDSLIEITAPKTVEVQRTKNITQGEAQQRLDYLAQLVDSGGWSVRGVQTPNSAMNTDVFYAAQQTQDILDADTPVAQSLDYMIDQSDAKHYQAIMHHVKTAAAVVPATDQTSSAAPSYNYFASQTPQSDDPSTQVFLDDTTLATPVPTPSAPAISIADPLAAIQSAPTTSAKPVPADIMNLATNADLSIETIAHEANRLQQQNLQDGEVISLR